MIVTDNELASSFVKNGSKILVVVNLGWIAILIPAFAVIGSLIVNEPFIYQGMFVLTLLIAFLLALGDISGFMLLGIGMISYKRMIKRKSAVLAGISFVIWSLLSIIWRGMLVYSILILESLEREVKLTVFEFIQDLLFYNSLIFFVGMIFLMRHYETLTIISYSILNVLGTVILGGMFLIFTDETLVYIGYLFIFTPIFKNIVVPILGILVFKDIIQLIEPIKGLEKPVTKK